MHKQRRINKRGDTRKVILSILTISILQLLLMSCNEPKTTEKEVAQEASENVFTFDQSNYKHWVWIGPDENDTDEELALRYQKYAAAGIVGIFFERDSERHFRAAKAQGLQAHRWMWIMNRGDLVKEHPEWAAVSRSGQSTATNPPYVGYYRWVCASRPEVQEFLQQDVQAQLEKEYIDGIHFDYIRYSDVVLASNLWAQYGIVQLEEYPEYDFCYCDVCKTKFAEQYNVDIDKIKYPQTSLSWRDFRYQAVNNIVASLVEVAHQNNKPTSAAVFPTPDVAKKLVLQDWTNWTLDAVFPMIYHGFYQEEVPWIGSAVQQGLHGLHGRFPLYAGLYMPDFKDKNEFAQGVEIALRNGAAGISVFGEVDDEVLSILKKNSTKQKDNTQK